jgi:alanine racemase
VRPTYVEIDLDAVRHNVGVLASTFAPAELLAVVKAEGYGHGASEVALAALEAGATRLGVALTEEAAGLRAAGVDAPILLLSEPHRSSHAEIPGLGVTATVYTASGIAGLAAAAAEAGSTIGVHLKIDTGMHRVGATPADATMLARRIVAAPGLRLEGVYTHLAVADEPRDPYTGEQLARFEQALAELRGEGIDPGLVHAANSAGGLAHPASRYDLVRCGIAVYGIDPSPALAGVVPLRPALRLVSAVSMVKRVPGGSRVSYGLRYECAAETVLATVPIGYADGVPRRLGAVGGEVLIGGRRLPIAGTVTMDQIVVDCGPDAEVAVDDEVVLIGSQGAAAIGVDDWARRLDTIGYEVVTRVGPRVRREYR